MEGFSNNTKYEKDFIYIYIYIQQETIQFLFEK